MFVLSGVVIGISTSDALLSSTSQTYVCQSRPLLLKLLPGCSSGFSPQTHELRALPNIGNNAIVDRHAFLADAFWSTTSSSVAVASTAVTSTTIATDNNINSAESMCQNGALMGESAVPGAYSSLCMGLAERIVPLPKYRERMAMATKTKSITANVSGEIQQQQKYFSQSGTIVVRQKAGGSGNTGMTVWNSGLLLTRLLDAMVDELQQRQRQKQSGAGDDANVFWRNQEVLELGCGTGLCSIAAYRLGAKSVVATDGNPGVLQLADSNIQQNCYSGRDGDGTATATTDPTSNPGGNLSTIRAEPLQWGFLNAMDYSEGASFVIGADLTYNPGGWRALAETIETVLKTENDNASAASSSKRCYALYLSVGHDGFNVNAEMDGFLSVAKEVGLVTLPDGVEGIDLPELLMKTLSDTEKKILAQGGGFRVAVLGRKQVSRR